MPKFYTQNKKRINPRYFLHETTESDTVKEGWKDEYAEERAAEKVALENPLPNEASATYAGGVFIYMCYEFARRNGGPSHWTEKALFGALEKLARIVNLDREIADMVIEMKRIAEKALDDCAYQESSPRDGNFSDWVALRCGPSASPSAMLAFAQWVQDSLPVRMKQHPQGHKMFHELADQLVEFAKWTIGDEALSLRSPEPATLAHPSTRHIKPGVGSTAAAVKAKGGSKLGQKTVKKFY